MTRRVLAIQDYAPKIQHITGRDNQLADCLSRLPYSDNDDQSLGTLIASIFIIKPNSEIQKALKNLESHKKGQYQNDHS